MMALLRRKTQEGEPIANEATIRTRAWSKAEGANHERKMEQKNVFHTIPVLQTMADEKARLKFIKIMDKIKGALHRSFFNLP